MTRPPKLGFDEAAFQSRVACLSTLDRNRSLQIPTTAERRDQEENADPLRGILRNDLKGEEVLIVSNREPYIHVRRNERIEVQRLLHAVLTSYYNAGLVAPDQRTD